MAKIIRLASQITLVPAEHRDHFYRDFGAVVNQLLQIKEFNIFYAVLAAFMEWAKTTDLADLNFMVPEDPTVQTLLQNFMNGSKVDLEECPYDKAILNQRAKSLAYGLKDLEIMEKFCTPTFYPLKATQAASPVPRQILVPELAKKLVEVEYMLRG